MTATIVPLRRDGLVVVRLPGLGWSTRVHTRSVVVTIGLLVAAFAVFAWSLSVGDFPIPLKEVLATLVGGGSEDSGVIVRKLRLPRGLTGLLVGAGFGISGAIFQRLARNPLASPDIVGVNAGAAVAAVFTIVILGASGLGVTVGALVGSSLTTVAIYPPGRITVIVGANACGKSTLLRGLARLLKPRTGSVLLDGVDIHRLSTREVATRVGILPQQPVAPEGITVADLVARGRYPHQRWLRRFSSDDEAAVDAALTATGTTDLADRSVDELSGGQRQRVWIALAPAQGTPLMLLDEPTTFLDLAHQVEVLDLLAQLNREEGRTIVAVLHDLNLACRYGHHLVAMRGGAIVAEGPPAEVVEPELVRDVFGLAAEVMPDPLSGTPLVLPVPTRPDDPQRSETTMTDETPSTAAATADTAESGTDPVAEIMAAFGPDVLNRMNVDFEDSVLFVGRILGERPAATAARITDIDRHGVDMVVTDPEGDHRARVDFVEEIAEVGQLTNELLGIVVRAREVSGEPGMTSGEREFVKLSGIRTFITEVISVSDVNAHCRQITFAGDDLGQFHLAGPDTFVYVLVPPPGRNDLTIDQSFSWDDYWTMPDDERPVGAYYTVRRWRPESNEVDILFVLHDNPGAASDWARRAQPGDPAALWGPRTSYEPPADTDWYLLVADDTGLPAISSILEQLPVETQARVYVEVDNPDEQHELASPPDVEITWLYRNGAKPGTTSLLPDAVRRLTWPGGNPYVWGAGESHTMTQIRKYVRHELELSREAVMLEAYWRHSDYHGDGDDGERDYPGQ